MANGVSTMTTATSQCSRLKRHAKLAAACKKTDSELSRIHWNSLDLNSLDYYVWGAMLEKYHKLQPKKTTGELKVALQAIWKELPQEHINNPVANLPKTWLPAWLPVDSSICS